MDDGRYAVVTADERDGHEGQYRLGFSETAEFDGDRMKIMEGVSLESLKKDLAGIADGSIVVGENRLEYAKTQENAPASGESVVNGQVMAESANEAQRAEFGGVSEQGNSVRHSLIGVAPDGKKIYQSNFPQGTPKAAKSQRILDYIRNVWSKEPIRLVISNGETSRTIYAQFDPTVDESKVTQTDASKLAGGNRHGNHTEQRVTLDLADDYYQIASEATYNYSKEEIGKTSDPHKDVKMWHYFVNDIYFAEYGKSELTPYTVTINVKEKADGDFVYSFNAEKESSTQRTLHAAVSTRKGTNGELFLDKSIPQNSEKSTDSEKKVVEKEGAGRSALPMQRARGDQTKTQAKAEKRIAAEQVAEQRRGEQETAGASPTESTTERAMPSRGYTDAEANEARGLVSDFDLLPPSVRRSIIELVRSGKKSGASKNFLRHSANLIAYWRRGLWVIADDKTRDDGFYTVFSDGSRLIVVKPNREAKAVSETLMHELGHDVWARADEKTRKVLYELATEGVKQEEIDAIRERYREELTKRGEIPEKAEIGQSGTPVPTNRMDGKEMTEAEVEALLDEEVATNLMGEIIGKEEFLKRFDGSETSALKRILRTLSNMKKRFTGKDKYLYRKADDLFKAFTKVMAMEEVGAIEMGERMRRALPSKKDPSKLDPRTVTREDVYNMLKNAEEGKYDARKYIPVRIGTPAIVIDQIKAKQGKTIPNYPLIMQIKKLVGALERGGVGDDGLPNRLEVEEIISIIEAMSDPLYIVYEPANEEHPEPSYVEVVKFKMKNGRKAFAVLELVGEDKDDVYLLENYEGGTYNVFVTAYPPTSDKLKELLNNKKNKIIYNKKKDFSQRTSGITVPSVLNDPSFFDDSIHQNDPKVNTSGENILSEEDQSLLFDEEFYSRYASEDKKKIVDDVAELEMLRESEDFAELSDDEALEVNAKLKALKAGYNTVYDYYVETEKKKLLEDYAKNGTRSRTYRLLEEKRKKFNKAKKLDADVSSATPLQKAQFDIIQATNPMYDDYHTGIRSPKEIKTFQEVVDDPESFSWGDFSRDDARRALKRGKIKVYSSYEIENGVFVSTSYKQSLGYAGNNPTRVYSREVALDSVAWINGDEGQYADTSSILDVPGATRRALPKKDADKLIERAYANGMGQKSQTTAKPKKTAEQIAQENADKKIAAEKSRLEREGSETLKKNSRQIARIDKNLDYLKNAVLHRRNTDGGNASSIIFEDPALRAVVKRLASRGTAYGLLHKSTREGMQDLLTWYTPENEILSGNAIDELLSASPQSVSNVFGGYNADIRDKKKPVNKRRAFLNQVYSVIYSSTSALA